MREPNYTTQFRRDLKKVGNRGYPMQRLKDIIVKLLADEQLPGECRVHRLKGKWKHCHELHVGPDWLLVYRMCDNECIFYRTGTHSDILEE